VKPNGAVQKDMEDLKALMAKERETTTFPVNEFGKSSQNILLYYLNLSHVADVTFLSDNPLLFEKLSDGVVMCRFFDNKVPEVLDARIITTQIREKRDKIDNWNLCVQSVRAVGGRLHDVQVENLADGDSQQILKVLWAIIKLGLEKEVKACRKYCTKIFADSDHETWNLETTLLNWVNEIAANKGVSRTASSITEDFKDSYFYLMLMDEVLETGNAMMSGTDDQRKATEVIISSELLDRGDVITMEGILKGIYWQNIVLLVSLFVTAATLSL